MTRLEFVRRYEDEWFHFSNLLSQLEEKRKDGDLPGRFPEQYRRLCHQLSLCRARRYGRDLEQRLHLLSLRGYRILYRESTWNWRSLGHLVARDFPRAVRREWKAVLLSTLLLVGPQLVVSTALRIDPDLAEAILDRSQLIEFESMYADHEGVREQRESESDILMFGFYIQNNISIALRIFASGLLYGVGSIFFLVWNGVYFGVVEGHLHNLGLAHNLYVFIAGHIVLEDFAIIIAGAGGLLLGDALISPGALRRSTALKQRAHSLLPMVYGCILMLVAAAFVEAFWSSRVTDPAVRYSVGATIAVAVAIYFLYFGRRRAS